MFPKRVGKKKISKLFIKNSKLNSSMFVTFKRYDPNLKSM